jgi:hypothetical protein
MESQYRGAFRHFNADSIYSEDVQVPDHRIIWRSTRFLADGRSDPEQTDLIQIANRGVNIVSSRDARANVRTALRIALGLAADGLRVLYLNSYAGLVLLRESLQAERAALAEQGRTFDQAHFHILDVKMGMWDHCAREIEQTLYEDTFVSYHSEERKITQQIDVLVMNSFEFSAIGYSQKLDVATRLAAWMEKIELTCIVFTQETPAIMEAGIPVRGPLGFLTTAAATVARMDMPMRKPVNKKDTEDDGVHEKSKRVHEQIPRADIHIYYDGGGKLIGVEYKKSYKGPNYPLGHFPRRLTDPVPDGMNAIQIVGMPQI